MAERQPEVGEAIAFGTSLNSLPGGHSVPGGPIDEALFADLENAARHRATTPRSPTAASSTHPLTNEPFATATAVVAVDGGTPHQQPRPHEPMTPSRTQSMISNGSIAGTSFREIPKHLHAIFRQIRSLGHEDLLAVVEITQKRAYRDVFSTLQYTGSAWYLPNIRATVEGEKECELRYEWERGLIVAIAGRRMEFLPVSYLFRIGILALLWLVVWAALPGGLVEHGKQGYVFEPVVAVVFCAIIGGIICRLLQLPPLFGVLWIGIMWGNIPSRGYLTSGIHSEVRTISSRLGLAMILMRAGYSVNLFAVRLMWKNTLSLAFLPSAVEATVHALLANALFDYGNYTWAFAQGMICSIVSAAVIVPGVLMLQSQGYATGKGGPLNLVLSAVGLDTCSGIWASNFILGLLFDQSMSLGLAIALGPIQIVAGIVIGVILGFLFHFVIEIFKNEAQRMPNGKFSAEHMTSVMIKAKIIFLALAFGAVFIGYKYALAGGGACVTMFFALTVAHMWSKDADAELMQQKGDLGGFLANFWDLLIMPYLFAMVGTNVDIVSLFDGEFFPKALLVWFVSNVGRFATAVTCTAGMEMPFSSRVIVGQSWLGKAASQGALGGIALQKVEELIKGAAGDPAKLKDLEGALRMAKYCKNIAVLYILLGVPIAAIGLVKIGPHVLIKKKL